jgi:Ca-activated chloride channel family protein
MLRCGAAVTIVCITLLLAYARESRAPQQNPLRVDLDLVLVNVTIADPENRPVTGLERQHFQLSEDKVGQSITYFSAEDSPVSACIVLDTSNSMKDKIAIAKKAVEAFLKAGNPED